MIGKPKEIGCQVKNRRICCLLRNWDPWLLAWGSSHWKNEWMSECINGWINKKIKVQVYSCFNHNWSTEAELCSTGEVTPGHPQHPGAGARLYFPKYVVYQCWLIPIFTHQESVKLMYAPTDPLFPSSPIATPGIYYLGSGWFKTRN